MTAEDYIQQQVEAFKRTCIDMDFTLDWSFNLSDIPKLDEARDKAIEKVWPNGTPEELGNAVAIMWGAMFSKAIYGSYITRWGIDPDSKTPVVIVKCGQNGLQVKALLVGAQSFNNGQLFTDTWAELKKELDAAGAELA